MVSGTIHYEKRDFHQARSLFDRTPLPLWKATCAIAALGAVIGWGIATIASRILENVEVPVWPDLAAWGAVVGSIAVVTTGAWRASERLSEAQLAATKHQQSFSIDGDGIRLASATAETKMAWAHFLQCRIDPNQVALRTQDETIILFRPEFVADENEWGALKQIVNERTDAGAHA